MDESGTTAGRDVVDLHGTAEWQVLTERFAHLRGSHLRELFAAEPDRGTTMTATAGDLVLDYSKHRVDRAALDALFAVALDEGGEAVTRRAQVRNAGARWWAVGPATAGSTRR